MITRGEPAGLAISINQWILRMEFKGLPANSRLGRFKELVKEAFADSPSSNYSSTLLPTKEEECKRYGVTDYMRDNDGSIQPGMMQFDSIDEASEFYSRHRSVTAEKLMDLDTGKVFQPLFSVSFPQVEREL